MQYNVKQPISGFEDVKDVVIENADGITCLLKSANEDTYMQIALVHANSDVSFEVSDEIQKLLGLKEDSKCSIYFPVIIDKDVEKSVIFLNDVFFFYLVIKYVDLCVLSYDL